MQQRYFYLDAMRGILMTLGVVLHSAQVFNPAQNWLIASDQSTSVAAWLVDAIHLFRMPAFFVVSGFFCMLTLKRYGRQKFLEMRLLQIVIPLVATSLLLNSLQTFILNRAGWSNTTLVEFALEGKWVLHLWFLNYLVVYFLFASCFTWVFDRNLLKFPHLERLSPRTILTGLFLLLPLYTVFLRVISKPGAPLYWDLAGIIQGFGLMFYVQFFVFGLWLFSKPQIMAAMARSSVPIGCGVIIAASLLRTLVSSEDTVMEKILSEYLHMLAVWFSIGVCFSVFFRLTNIEVPWLRELSEASYSVYLVHQFLVVMVGLLIISNGWHAVWSMTFLMTVVFSLSFVVHKFLIQPIAPLRFLFNGK